MINQRELCVARAPTRIDLGGGWTDVPPYCEREGGFVCNVAITRYATARLLDAGGHAHDAAVRDPLVRAVFHHAAVSGVHATLDNDFPLGAGLGGSSAASAALFGAIAAWKGEPWDRSAIAEAGRRVEVETLGIAGGRQDHYAATHGGALALTFGSSTQVRSIPITADVRSRLAERSVLIYTGQSRISGDTITSVLGAYERGEVRVLDALRRMRALAESMAAALESGNLDAIGALVGEHWAHQRSLHPSIPTERIDEIVSRSLRAGALGAKAMGASGGGCVLIMCPDGRTDAVRDAVASLGDLMDFAVDEAGLTILAESPA
ncbi:MAG: hypothetical protein WD801_15775 [Gemmatimonadaceae bacterium]